MANRAMAAALAALAALAASAAPSAAQVRDGGGGKIEPALAQAFAAAPATPVRVVYVLRGPARPRGPDAPPDDVAGLAAARDAVRGERDAVAAVLRGLGQEVVYASDYAGVVVARGGAAAVAAAAADPRVVRVYREAVARPRLAIAKRVTQATEVRAAGVDGSGARVGVVEEGRIGRHPALPPGRRVLCRPEAAAGASLHKTEVAGVVQSGDPVETGMAPGVTLIDGVAADLGDAEVMAAIDCVVARGAVAVNLSIGSDTDGRFDALADYVDRLVYNTGVTVVVAVSNRCDQRMGSPEIAFNDLSVGAFSDRGTLDLADDLHACNGRLPIRFSAYRDPPSRHGDREQPDVVAPGDRITTTGLKGGFVEDIGTSFAAPMVAGEVALLQGRAPFSLARQAERVRAIVMASARHNVSDGPGLGERDGAGGVRLAAADAVLRAGGSWWFATAGGRAGFPREQGFRAAAGQRVRVALAWAHKPEGGHETVSTDLDLRVADPGGRVLAASTSRDNNAELVAFVAPTTGSYRIRIDNARASDGPEHVGLAVSLTER